MGEVDWAGRMARLPDEDLVEIVSSGDEGGYEQYIVDAATVELDRRELALESIADIEASVQREQASRNGRATEPLGNAGWVVFAIIGPILIVTLGIVIFFAAMGQSQKAKDALGAIALSFLFWMLVAGTLTFFLG
jgi:hypothetical protein